MRLFVAINLPAELRHGIWQAAAPLRGPAFPVRWVDPEDLHLTLKFLGEVGPERQAEIAGALESAASGARCFDLPIGGFGVFPSSERPRVVWVGCEGVPPLELLQHRLEQTMQRLGFEIEGRPFRPHLTLGRVRDGAHWDTLAPLGPTLADLSFADLARVGSVELMESRQGPQGVRYRAVHSVGLAGQEDSA